jgi:hypothetical protein
MKRHHSLFSSHDPAIFSIQPAFIGVMPRTRGNFMGVPCRWNIISPSSCIPINTPMVLARTADGCGLISARRILLIAEAMLQGAERDPGQGGSALCVAISGGLSLSDSCWIVPHRNAAEFSSVSSFIHSGIAHCFIRLYHVVAT